MYYIHYDSEGYILSAANHNNAPLWIETSKEIYQDFITGKKQFHEYKVIEDIRTKGKMQIILVDFDETAKNEHESGAIQKNTNLTKGIVFIQKENFWIVNNFIDDETATHLSIGDDYYKEYYVVDKKNRYILLDTFRINLKDFVLKDSIHLYGYCADKEVSLVTHGSHIPHVHITGDKNYENKSS